MQCKMQQIWKSIEQNPSDQSVWKVNDASVIFRCFHCLFMEKSILMGLFVYHGIRHLHSGPNDLQGRAGRDGHSTTNTSS